MHSRPLSILFTLSICLLSACSAAPGETDDTASGEPAEVVTAALLGTPAFLCPSVFQISYQGTVVRTFDANEPRDFNDVLRITAGIENHAQTIACKAFGMNFADTYKEEWQWGYTPGKELVRNVNDTVIITNMSGNTLRSFTCPKRDFLISGSGWPTTSNRATAVANVFGSDPTTKLTHFYCKYNFPDGVARVSKGRPSDIIVASANAFYARSQVTGSDRDSACARLCDAQCTANIPPDGHLEGIAQCISNCVTQCKR